MATNVTSEDPPSITSTNNPLVRQREESIEPNSERPEIKRTKLSDEAKAESGDIEMDEEEAMMNVTNGTTNSAAPVIISEEEEAMMNGSDPLSTAITQDQPDSTPINTTNSLSTTNPSSLDYIPLPPSTSLFHPSPKYIFSSAQVGISEYLTPNLPPISGIIKQRFTDFMVWEITPEDDMSGEGGEGKGKGEGTVLRLKEIGEPRWDGGWNVEKEKDKDGGKDKGKGKESGEGDQKDAAVAEESKENQTVKTEEKATVEKEDVKMEDNASSTSPLAAADESVQPLGNSTPTDVSATFSTSTPEVTPKAGEKEANAAESVPLDHTKDETKTPIAPETKPSEELNAVTSTATSDPTSVSKENKSAAPIPAPVEEIDISTLPTELQFPPTKTWGPTQTSSLLPFLTPSQIISLHDLFLEGRTPPPPPAPSTDGGWGARATKVSTEEEILAVQEKAKKEAEKAAKMEAKFGKDWERRGGGRGGRGGRGMDRGGRGGRGGGRGGGPSVERGAFGEFVSDHREVLSDIITDKAIRSNFHAVIRQNFSGTFETFAREIPNQLGSSRIAIKWGKPQANKQPREHQRGNEGGSSSRGGGAAGGSGRDRPTPRAKLPQYIHFTLQKANRDTQDCLGAIARNLHVLPKSLTTCGTKDKRGITVQRVCLNRGYKITVQDLWKAANGITNKWRTKEEAVTKRGDRGVRIGDIKYSDEYLDLGMLKGNHFQITLRNVKAENPDHIDQVMTSLKTRGFINYYGMQRFGTGTVATHSIGLSLLQGKWQEATESILAHREGEQQEAIDARNAWFENKDIRKALMLMPRRNVAERCLWEFWTRENSALTDYYGALMNIPRNLRLIYVHAYQSYVWNAVVSQRIRMSPDQPLVGDVVFDEEVEEDGEGSAIPKSQSAQRQQNAKDSRGPSRSWESSPMVKVKTIKQEDLENGTYTMQDVIVPLPGHSITFPEGALFEKTREIMAMDGLDPLKMRRDQKEYSLAGSYRRVIHMPKRLEWKLMHYNDPDIALSQSDEDRILNIEPPPTAEQSESGEFLAVQVSLSLGTSAYATMALREITKTETSSHHQTLMTEASEDQVNKGMDAKGDGEEKEEKQEGNEEEEEAAAAADGAEGTVTGTTA